MKWFHHNHDRSATLAELLPDENICSARTIRKVVKIGCLVNAFLMVLKLSAGYFGHSEALFADGFHSLNDMAADIIMLVFVGISFKSADVKYSYGYGKFETFSSLLISSFLMVVACMICWEGVESIIGWYNGEILERPDIWTVVVVLFSMACKEGLYRYYFSAGKKSGSNALVANAWHHRSDAFASIATLIGVTFAHFFGENFRIVDPIASVVIAVFIFFPALRLFRPAFFELMERSLPVEIENRTKKLIESVPGVERIKYLRSRRNGHHYIFDIGIEVKPTLSIAEGEVISRNIEKLLEKEYCPHVMTSVNMSASEPSC